MPYCNSFISPTTLMNTPWGEADHISNLDNVSDDIITVSTSSHGGMGIKASIAMERLTPAAILQGDRFNGYFWFEKDIDWSILAWELPEYWDRLVSVPDDIGTEQRKEHQKMSLLNVLSEWRLDYLIQIGVEPIPEKAQIYKDRQQAARMRREKHPDLIVIANHCDENSVIVGTADGISHKVTIDSYHAERFSDLFLLSNCEVFEQ